MTKILYKYNPETVNFEKVEHKNKFNFFKFVAYIFTTLIILSIALWFLFKNIQTPKERILSKENINLKQQYSHLNNKIKNLEDTFIDFQEKDDYLYRVLFEASPMPDVIRKAGTGGINRYEQLENISYLDTLLKINAKVDVLLKRAYIQSKSYEELEKIAKTKKNMLEHIPAIMPLAKKYSKWAVSGWGYRKHPIFNIKKFHYGLDFPALRGTPVYATGNGKILKAQYNVNGYGNYVIINHGFGYETLYAHMSKYIVKKGQKIKRGDVIGYTGNTGLSVAPHLHYEVKKDKVKVNPTKYIFTNLTIDEYNLLVENAKNSGQSLD